jgi:hypothetical protein
MVTTRRKIIGNGAIEQLLGTINIENFRQFTRPFRRANTRCWIMPT